jgi:hypothetical protein
MHVKAVSERSAASLVGHEHYGTLRGVRYFDMELAFNEPHICNGLFSAGKEPCEDWLRRAILTYNTCEDIVVVFWRHLNMVLPGM